MPRTTGAGTVQPTIPTLAHDVASALLAKHRARIEDFSFVLGLKDEEFRVLVDQEFAELGGPQQDPEDQPFHRDWAAASVGYRLGLEVGRMLAAGGAR